MNRLSIERRSRIIGCLVEGNSLRATARMTDSAINTVVKLLVDAGKACSEYQDRALRNLTCQRLQCDEIWAFCYAKEKNVPKDKIFCRHIDWDGVQYPDRGEEMQYMPEPK